MEISENNYAQRIKDSNYEVTEIQSLQKNEKKYYLIQCLICSNILSRSIELEFLESDEKNIYSFISYPFLISIKTSKKKSLEFASDEKEIFIFNKISCLFCRSKIGKYLISSTNNLFEKLEKVKLDNKACGL